MEIYRPGVLPEWQQKMLEQGKKRERLEQMSGDELTQEFEISHGLWKSAINGHNTPTNIERLHNDFLMCKQEVRHRLNEGDK